MTIPPIRPTSSALRPPARRRLHRSRAKIPSPSTATRPRPRIARSAHRLAMTVDSGHLSTIQTHPRALVHLARSSSARPRARVVFARQSSCACVDDATDDATPCAARPSESFDLSFHLHKQGFWRQYSSRHVPRDRRRLSRILSASARVKRSSRACAARATPRARRRDALAATLAGLGLIGVSSPSSSEAEGQPIDWLLKTTFDEDVDLVEIIKASASGDDDAGSAAWLDNARRRRRRRRRRSGPRRRAGRRRNDGGTRRGARTGGRGGDGDEIWEIGRDFGIRGCGHGCHHGEERPSGWRNPWSASWRWERMAKFAR